MNQPLSTEFVKSLQSSRKRQLDEGFLTCGVGRRVLSKIERTPVWVLEDHPDLALEREKLLDKCLDFLVEANQQYGKMRDDSKTAKACRQNGMKVGLQGLYARIIWYELLNQVTKLGDVGTNPNRDSIFPIEFAGDHAVIKELISAGRPQEASHSIIYEVVGKRLVKCAERLIEMRKTLPPTPVSIRLSIERKDNGKAKDTDPTVVLYRLSYNGVLLEISYEHMKKLLRLYRLHTDSDASVEDSIFLKRVFCVIQRYESLSGKSDGYQMAFPNVGFQYLKNNFYVKTECFASPLNCYNSRFCSVARDTDQFFGSLGNFFKFDGPTGRLTEDDEGLELGGSFEANPPFVEAIMNEMADRIFYLLRKYNGIAPFSFVVIVPAWEDCRGNIEMTKSEFQRPHPGKVLRLAKNQHDYRPGMQHKTTFTQQKSKVDTFVFFLQNDLGAQRWPVSERHYEELKVLLAEYSLVDLHNVLLVKS